MTDWNPSDPDAGNVYYDLGAWDFDQRAEAAAELAEAEVPHAWEDDELVVPEEYEEQVDQMLDVLEARLGIDSGETAVAPGELAVTDVDLPDPEPFDDSGPVTEFDLGDWSPVERAAAANAARIAQVPHRWEGDLLLVPTEVEDVVEDLLDEVERLGAVALGDDAGAGRQKAPPYEVVSTLFLTASRLQRDPLDEEALEDLHGVLEDVTTQLPPVGVTPTQWDAACTLAQEISTGVRSDELDVAALAGVARRLRELLAPLV